jgi:hypothetical protein
VDASVEAARRFYGANIDAIGVGVTAQAIGLCAFAVFLCGLRGRMRAADGGRLLTDLATVGGTLVAAWLWLAASAAMVPVAIAGDDRRFTAVPDDAVHALGLVVRLGETGGDLSAVPRGLLILAVSLLAFRTRFLPRWLAAFGLFVAAASLICLVGPAWWIAPFGIAALIGLFGFAIWVALVSVFLLVRR